MNPYLGHRLVPMCAPVLVSGAFAIYPMPLLTISTPTRDWMFPSWFPVARTVFPDLLWCSDPAWINMKHCLITGRFSAGTSIFPCFFQILTYTHLSPYSPDAMSVYKIPYPQIAGSPCSSPRLSSLISSPFFLICPFHYLWKDLLIKFKNNNKF